MYAARDFESANQPIDRARSRGMSELRILTDTPWHSAVEL